MASKATKAQAAATATAATTAAATEESPEIVQVENAYEEEMPPQMSDVFFDILSAMFTKDNINLTEALLQLNENVKVNNEIQSNILDVLRKMSSQLPKKAPLPST
jgi:hypothetical protein